MSTRTTGTTTNPPTEIPTTHSPQCHAPPALEPTGDQHGEGQEKGHRQRDTNDAENRYHCQSALVVASSASPPRIHDAAQEQREAGATPVGQLAHQGEASPLASSAMEIPSDTSARDQPNFSSIGSM